MAHPLMPFVTEEIWSYLPDREAELIVSAYPVADPARFDDAAEAEVDDAIELTRSLRRWRELAGVAPGSTLNARLPDGGAHPLVSRLARLDLDRRRRGGDAGRDRRARSRSSSRRASTPPPWPSGSTSSATACRAR